MIREVKHGWDDSRGNCYLCGDPAGFIVPDIYRRADGSNANEPIGPKNLRCAVCAVQDACDGERIFRLWPDEEDEPLSAEYQRFLRELHIDSMEV